MEQSEENEEYERPTWDEYFIAMCRTVKLRTTCDLGDNCAVIVKGKRILTTGYVGSPEGMPHCDNVGHIFGETKNAKGKVSKICLRTIHAEINAIVQAAKEGISLEGCTMYCLVEPCLECAKIIANSGIKKIIIDKRHADKEEPINLFEKTGIEVGYLNDSIV